MTQTIIHIDGSFCEGGGQLLRNAVTLSALLTKPVSISNVRQNRQPPGLRRQHEAGLYILRFEVESTPLKLHVGINLAASICSAETKGVEVRSTTVDFRPGPIQLPQALSADPGTAGSTTLLLQTALPCLLFSPPNTAESVLTLSGGTNAALAPQIDYTQAVLLPFLRHFQRSPTLAVTRRGYYPKGGGTVVCTVPAVAGPLPPVVLTQRGQLGAVRGSARVGGLPLSIAQRMVSSAHRVLVRSGIAATQIALTAAREHDADVVGAGGGIVLWAETDGGCVIGGSAVSTREKKPEAVGEEAAEMLVRNLDHGGCVDEYLQDQMIIFLALAKGTSIVKTGPLTDHTRYVGTFRFASMILTEGNRTAIHVAQRMTGAQFHVDENMPGAVTITCEGIGFGASSLDGL